MSWTLKLKGQQRSNEMGWVNHCLLSVSLSCAIYDSMKEKWMNVDVCSHDCVCLIACTYEWSFQYWLSLEAKFFIIREKQGCWGLGQGRKIVQLTHLDLQTCDFVGIVSMVTGNIRNLAMEKVASSVSFPCKYCSSGCPITLPHTDKPEHEETCEYR